MRRHGPENRKRRAELKRLESRQRNELSALKRADRKRMRGEKHRVIDRIEGEISLLLGKLSSFVGQEERIFLKAEIEHLRRLKARLTGTPRRKPPESGMPVPAIPPKGPMPMQGGAAAPLDFD